MLGDGSLKVAIIFGAKGAKVRSSLQGVQDNLAIDAFETIQDMITTSKTRAYFYDRIIALSTAIKATGFEATVDALYTYWRAYSQHTQIIMMCKAGVEDDVARMFSNAFSSPYVTSMAVTNTSVSILRTAAVGDVGEINRQYGITVDLTANIEEEELILAQPEPEPEPEPVPTPEETPQEPQEETPPEQKRGRFGIGRIFGARKNKKKGKADNSEIQSAEQAASTEEQPFVEQGQSGEYPEGLGYSADDTYTDQDVNYDYQDDGYMEQNNGYTYQNDNYTEQSSDYDYQNDGYGEQSDGYDYQNNGYDEQGENYGYSDNGYVDQSNGYQNENFTYQNEEYTDSGYIDEQNNDGTGYIAQDAPQQMGMPYYAEDSSTQQGGYSDDGDSDMPTEYSPDQFDMTGYNGYGQDQEVSDGAQQMGFAYDESPNADVENTTGVNYYENSQFGTVGESTNYNGEGYQYNDTSDNYSNSDESGYEDPDFNVEGIDVDDGDLSIGDEAGYENPKVSIPNPSQVGTNFGMGAFEQEYAQSTGQYSEIPTESYETQSEDVQQGGMGLPLEYEDTSSVSQQEIVDDEDFGADDISMSFAAQQQIVDDEDFGDLSIDYTQQESVPQSSQSSEARQRRFGNGDSAAVVEEEDTFDDMSVGDLEATYRQQVEEPRVQVVEKVVEKEVIREVNVGGVKSAYNAVLKGKSHKIIVVTGDRGSGITSLAYDIAKFFAKNVPVLYFDGDVELHGLLSYIEYDQFCMYEPQQQQGIKLCKNARAFQNCVTRFDTNLDILTTNYGVEVSDDELENAQSVVAEIANRYGVVVVDAPFDKIDCFTDLLLGGNVCLCIEANKRGFMNAICKLENSSLSMRYKRKIVSSGTMIHTKVNPKLNMKKLYKYVDSIVELEDVNWLGMHTLTREPQLTQQFIEEIIEG